jgi:3-hydroxyisobutyrate dehydrogenase
MMALLKSDARVGQWMSGPYGIGRRPHCLGAEGQHPKKDMRNMERIGVVGLGTMGGAMAHNIARAGFPLTVWNRTPERTRAFEVLGIPVASTPAALGGAVDVVLVCVSDSPDVESVLFGPDGVASGAPPGSLVIDCSTIDPEAARRFAARLGQQGVAFVDAPVTGGSEGARDGTLAILVGGEVASVERARPILAAIGQTMTHFGPVGAGQAAKAVNQVIVAGTYIGVAEGMVLAIKAGLDPEQVVAALSGGAGQSWILTNRSHRMLANDYPPGFQVALHLKDLTIALSMARDTGTVLPVTALVAQLEVSLMALGHGADDLSALARSVRALSGLEA